MPTDRPADPLQYEIGAYDYALPSELVAQEPLAQRDASRLLVLDRATGAIAHRTFADLAELLRPGDLLVTNRTPGLPGPAPRTAGGRRRRRGPARAAPRARRLGRTRPPGPAAAAGRRDRHRARLPGRGRGASPGGRRCAGRSTPSPPLDGTDADTALERHGHVPLPPYIHRPDRARGPRALPDGLRARDGLRRRPHRRPALHARSSSTRLRERGVERAELVLHVGPRDVPAGRGRGRAPAPRRPRALHRPAETPPRRSTAPAREGRRVVAVGTTATRALESALDADGRLAAGAGETDLVIVPGFRFRAVDALVTNFHLPRSSLLLLVSAFAGRERVLAAYAEAVRQRYRFYSYGDAMLVV